MNQYVQLHDNLAEMVRHSAKLIVPWLVDWVKPASVLDVGCGNGTFLAAFRAAGVQDIFGYDGDYIRPESLEIPRELFQAHDLTQPLPLARVYDLAICTEVAEHLPEADALHLVKQLTTAAPMVVFSAAIPGQGGVHHINEQWQSYWVRAFADLGYDCWDLFRARLWNQPEIGYWYAQNLFLFSRASEADRLPESIRQNHQPMPSDVVHPKRLTAVCRELGFLNNPSVGSACEKLAGVIGKKLGLKVKS